MSGRMTEQLQKRDRLQGRILKEIRLRYIFAVGLIASFAILTFCVNQTLNRRMKEDFKTINLSGRQRMLSQRIALLTIKGDIASEKDAVKNFQDSLEFLLKTRFVSDSYPDVLEIYKGENGLDEKSREYIALASSPDVRSEQDRIFALSQELLKKYEQVTYLKQHISESEFRNHLTLEILLLLMNFFILTFEVLFIFRPMAGKVRETFSELNKIEEQSFLASRLALIGEIASNIGHEIKNPLFVLRHYASKITAAASEIERASIEQHIDKNADRIGKILKALSTQARETSRDKMEDSFISTIVDDAVEMFGPKIKYGNIDLRKDFHFDGPIRCRHAAISQVIANLIANAIDSVADDVSSQKLIEIESGQDIDGIYVRVRDSGPGVPDELKEKIFDSFITTKKAGKGTGLGLSISRKIMEEHQGTLNLKAEISSSCFELRFPA